VEEDTRRDLLFMKTTGEAALQIRWGRAQTKLEEGRRR
jgi:hypothetical protein